MKIHGLYVSRVEGASLSEKDIDQMLALRAQSMSIKPEMSPEDDRDLFAAWIRAPGSCVAIGRDERDQIHVFIDMNSRLYEVDSDSYLVCYGNFVFASEKYRKHVAFTLGNFWHLVANCAHHRFVPSAHVLWLAALYPTTFVLGARTFSMWVAGESQVPEPIVKLIDRAAPEVFGASWLPGERLVKMRTIPPQYEPRSPEAREIMARYEERNPHWRQGYSALMIAPMSLSNLLGPATLMLRRFSQFVRG